MIKTAIIGTSLCLAALLFMSLAHAEQTCDKSDEYAGMFISERAMGDDFQMAIHDYSLKQLGDAHYYLRKILIPRAERLPHSCVNDQAVRWFQSYLTDVEDEFHKREADAYMRDDSDLQALGHKKANDYPRIEP
jgi:hypothetical protein